jgi:hypothetical protein
MKNIFLLPTDQPSRLVKDLNGVFSLMGELIEVGGPICNINIYITSDEEIKEGDWYLDTFNTQRIKANEFSDHKHYGNACKKIIFTTDFRLAPDVQKIDDEFLEWFVENPTCEYVEIVKNTTTPCECYYTKHCISTELSIKHHCREVQHNDYYTIVIPIIIPQEEPKQKAEKVTPMNDLLQDLKDTKLSIQDSIKEIKDGFIRNTVDLYIQKTLDVIILKIETELLEKEWKELEDAKLCEPLKSWDDEKPKQGPPTYDESIQHMLNAHKIPKELFGAKQEPKLCDGDLYFVGMVTDITEEYECLRCGQKYRYTAKNGSCNFFQLTKCTKGIPQEEPKPLDNLDERFKRDMSMIVMPLDNKNIPEEPKQVICRDKFDRVIQDGCYVDVQNDGVHKVYRKEDGQLYFKPYGEEERVSNYFSNDLILIPYSTKLIMDLKKEIADKKQDVFYNKKQEEPKQETLEEAADNWVRKPLIGTRRDSFMAGANWQTERMYSESIQFGTWLLSQDITSRGEGLYIDDKGNLLTVKDLFEQFKKK